MPIAETIDSLRESLLPIEALRNEQSELEGWVQESFTSLEKLHEELATWQGELAKHETEIDLREDALGQARKLEDGLSVEVQQLRQQMTDARHELLQLEEENGQQLEELEELERQQAVLQADLEAARARAEDLAGLLEEEKQRTAEEQQWTVELQQMRQLLQRQGELLEGLAVGESSGEASPAEETAAEAVAKPDQEGDSSRSTELRRRAKARRAAKKRQQGKDEEE